MAIVPPWAVGTEAAAFPPCPPLGRLLLLVLLPVALRLSHAKESAAEVERHLEMGRQMLAQGQLTDALSHFHAAVEGDPTNYLTYFKRATVYLALSRSKAALPDLDRVIELKPDFTSARIHRGMVLLKKGHLDDAHLDFEAVLRKEPHNEEALRHYTLLEPLRRDVEEAHYLITNRNYQSAVATLTKILEVCPWDPKLLEMRADAFSGMGDLQRAIHDIKLTTRLRNANTDAFYKLSLLHYELGDADESLNEVRECLKLDPDHKTCFPLYKKVKKLANLIKSAKELKGEQQYSNCADKTEDILRAEPKHQSFIFLAKSLKCHCLMKKEGGEPSDAIETCTEAIAIEQDPHVLCDRAEAYINDEQLEKAQHDYQRARTIDEHLERATSGVERVEKMLKQAKKRDYYKILGLRRTASKRDITKAYRKLAAKWHPDNFHGDEKQKAEKKFIDIASAKEVLSDPEKRQKFDNGEDPLDPESQAGQGFNPFGQGFQPFGGGGGPFQFKFHFN